MQAGGSGGVGGIAGAGAGAGPGAVDGLAGGVEEAPGSVVVGDGAWGVGGEVGVAGDGELAAVVGVVVRAAEGEEVPELSLICPSW